MSELSKLFRFKKKVDIIDSSGKVLDTVYMRIVGDADYNQARNIALAASRQLRVKLRDNSTPDYIANFSDLDVLTKEEKIIVIISSEVIDYRDEGITKLGIEKLPELNIDNPTLEQQEEHQKAIGDYRLERQKQLFDYMDKRSKERMEEIRKLSDEEVQTKYITSVINSRCMEEFSTAFREYCVYKATFGDDKYTKLAFDNFIEFKDCSTQLKSQLLVAYTSLEIGGEELKNL
jgi:hypothetical protein